MGGGNEGGSLGRSADLKTDKVTHILRGSMDRRKPPPTAEGWFVLHDFRSVDWDALRNISEEKRSRVLDEGRDYLEAAENLDDAEAGATATYAVNGHKADLLIVHLRPTLDDLNALERCFEQTALAEVTDRASSYISVTEVSGYTTTEPIETGDLADIEDEALRNYFQMRLYPSVPEASYVCFYPMSKRRDAEYNWYDLPFDSRKAHIERHGDIGREYAGRVTQMITGSIGFDNWEWGVTLWSDDPTVFKDLLYSMRFDPSTSRFAEFGGFYTGERLNPDQLGRFFDGGSLVTSEDSSPRGSREAGGQPHGTSGGGELREELAALGVYAGQPHGEDVHALVVYSNADPEVLVREVTGLRGNFEHYDTHVKTAVYHAESGEATAVVCLWETDRAAKTAAGFLSELPGVIDREEGGDGFGTMGLFYTVKPDHRGEFVETFSEITEVLTEWDGHTETTLLVNVEDETDMFIASRWRSKDDALEFFRTETFRETVEWGREILAARPRHVFLA